MMVYDYTVDTIEGPTYMTLCRECAAHFDNAIEEGVSSGACEYQGDNCEDN